MILELTIVELCALSILTGLLVWWYRSPELTPAWLASLVGLSWYLGFVGILLLPIDITHATYIGYSSLLLDSWNVVYWSTFVITWVILPILYEAWYAGELSWRERLVTGVRRNLKSYAIGLLLGVVCAIYLVATGETTILGLPSFLMVFGNTYGFLIVIALLGNGLVEVPRAIWRSTDPEKELERTHYRAVQCDADVYDYRCEVEETEQVVRRVARQLEGSSTANPELRMFAEKIIEFCDKFKYSKGVHRSSSRASHKRPSDPQEAERVNDLSAEFLADLLRKVRRAQEKLHAANLRWEAILESTKRLELAINGQSTTQTEPQLSGLKALLRRVASLWKERLRLPTLRAVSWCAAGMSVLILWSELTVAAPVNLSPFGLLLQAFAPSSDEDKYKQAEKGAFFLQFFALIPYAYMSVCTYYSLFRLRLIGVFALHGPHQSTPGPLMFNAMYLIRLQFPLGYTFLTMVSPPHAHGDTLSDEVAFKRLMSNMDTIPLFGQEFVVYAPIILGLLSLCSLFALFPRLLKLVGLDHEDMDPSTDEDFAERLREGRTLIERGLRRQQREYEQQARDSDEEGGVVNALHASRFASRPTREPTKVASARSFIEMRSSGQRETYSRVNQDSGVASGVGVEY